MLDFPNTGQHFPFILVKINKKKKVRNGISVHKSVQLHLVASLLVRFDPVLRG